MSARGNEISEQELPPMRTVTREVGSSSSTSSRDEWWIGMNTGIVDGTNTRRRMIHKVLELFRQKESCKGCFDPMVVSIGPYHHGNSKLQEVERLKDSMVRQFVNGCPMLQFPTIYSEVERISGDAREYYPEETVSRFNETAFTKLMFVDGCFVLQFIHNFLNNYNEEHMRSNVAAFVRRDLMLLENQLPYIVLETLMRLRFGGNPGYELIDNFISSFRGDLSPQTTCIQATSKFFDKCCSIFKYPFGVCRAANQTVQQNPEPNNMDQPLQQQNPAEETNNMDQPLQLQQQNPAEEPNNMDQPLQQQNPAEEPNNMDQPLQQQNPAEDANNMDQPLQQQNPAEEPNNSDNPLHLLDLFLTRYINTRDLRRNYFQGRQGRDWYSYPAAKELKALGIHFRPSAGEHFTDIKFRSKLCAGRLFLPRIMIDDTTKSMLLNLVAYEASPDAPCDDCGLTSYICLMDSLIDQAEDVKELRSKGIVFNLLGSDQQAAELFNDIAQDLVPNPYAFHVTRQSIDSHSRSRIRTWMAEWKHNHFSSPWTIIAFVAVTATILMTLLQTIYTVKGYYSGNGRIGNGTDQNFSMT